MVDLRVENTVLVNKWTLMGVEILEFNNCLLTSMHPLQMPGADIQPC